jgi:hypothetical protein
MLHVEFSRRRRAGVRPRMQGRPWGNASSINWFALATVAAIAALGVQCEPSDKPDIIVQNISNNASYSRYPCIVCDDAGHVVLAWTDVVDDSLEAICSVEKDEGGEWGERQVIHGSPYGARAPSLCFDNSGTLHAAWSQFLPPSPRYGWNIMYSRRPRGGDWAVPETITYGVAVQPRIAVGQDGIVHLIFADMGYGSNLCYSQRDTNGIWSPVEVVRDRYRVVGYWSVGALADGSCIAAWVDSNVTIIWSHRPADGVWSEPTAQPTTGLGLWAAMAAGHGACYLLYSDHEAKLVTLDSGPAWSPPDTTMPYQEAVYLGACVSAEGEPAVVSGTGGGRWGVWASIRRGSDGWRQCRVDNEHWPSNNTSIAVGPSGTLHVAWDSQDYPAAEEVFYAQVTW